MTISTVHIENLVAEMELERMHDSLLRELARDIRARPDLTPELRDWLRKRMPYFGTEEKS